MLGVRYAGPLPRDARLTSLSLYPHSIFTAETDRFETREELLRATVKDDAVIIIEGEVGEFSVPDGLASFVSERAGLWPDAGRSGPFSRSGLFENRGECHSGGRWPGHSRRPHGRAAHLYGGRPPRSRFRAGRACATIPITAESPTFGRETTWTPAAGTRRGHEGVCRPFVRGNFLPRGSHPCPARRHVGRCHPPAQSISKIVPAMCRGPPLML